MRETGRSHFKHEWTEPSITTHRIVQEEAAKPVKPPQPDPAAASPAAALPKKKKRKRAKEATGGVDEEVHPVQAPVAPEPKMPREAVATPPAPPAAPALPAADDAFRDWFMARLAEDFEAEIEGLNEADAPVGTRALLQALDASLALFSPAERRVALATAGIQAGAGPGAA